MRVLVVGGTGQVGSHILKQLVALPDPPAIRASTRSPDKANFPDGVEATAGDLTDPATFPQLFNGVDRAFVYTKEHTNYEELSAAAKAAGVQRLVLLSSFTVAEAPESKIGKGHKKAEDGILASGIHYTFIRAGFFSSNFHMFLDPQLARGDVVELPYPEALLSPVAEQDLAAVAVTALTTDKLQDEAVIVSGPQTIDFAAGVAAISRVREAAGKPPLTVKKLEEQEWVTKYTPILPIPAFVTAMMASMWGGMVNKQPTQQSSERLTGKPSTTMEQWAESRKGKWANEAEKGESERDTSHDSK